MADEAKSIATMKKFYGDRLYVPSGDDMEAEMLQGNDRSCIITVASLADAALEALLATNLPGIAKMTAKEFDVAFRFDGPLGPFSSRIDLAFYMGVIDEALRGQLHDLRYMRNAVAHTKRRVTFEDDALKNAAKRLFSPTGKYPLLNETADGYRRTFIAEGNLVYNTLAYGRDDAIRMTRDAFTEAGRRPPF